MSHLHCSDREGGCGLFWDPWYSDLPGVLLLLIATSALLTLLVSHNSFSQKYFQIHTYSQAGKLKISLQDLY